ncbi:hypothetical protein [Actinomycetospora chiangmaiensis]|uniref:hypothetical protein n=1 Tax=Actinomycetospora chiangmaiensis TaxID=402650 RepID=UPI00037160F2|nr:hypothetical protein [Actinomycetospora chiangmaiensis]
MVDHGAAPAGGGTTAARAPGARRRALTPRRVVALVLSVLVVVFIVENRDLTEIRLLIPVVLMPLWAALALCLGVGLVVGVIVGRQRRG